MFVGSLVVRFFFLSDEHVLRCEDMCIVEVECVGVWRGGINDVEGSRYW